MNWTQKEVESFVTVASKCEENGDRLFAARYHMFLRATDSVFITLAPSNKLFLTRKLTHYEAGEEYKVFEIATCSSCHTIYLVGRQTEDNHFEQSNAAGEDNLRIIFLLGNSISDSDEDHSLDDEDIKAEEYELCSRCGFLNRPGASNRCEHDKRFLVTVFKIRVDNPSHTLTKCLSCENTNSFGILRMFFSGQEAVTSVIGTALFEELPAYSLKREQVHEADDTGFGISNMNELVSKTYIANSLSHFLTADKQQLFIQVI